MDNNIYKQVGIVICVYFSKKKILKILSIIDKRYKILIIDNAREFDLKKNIEKNF